MADSVRQAAGAARVLALVACAGCASSGPPPRAVVGQPEGLEATPAPKEQPPPAPRKHGGSGQALGLVSLSIGGAAGVVAVVTSIMMLHDKSVRDDGCNAQKVCTPDAYSANQKLADLGGWNAGAYAVAGVGLVAGTVLVIAFPGGRGSSTAVVVAPNAAGAGLALWSAF
jgi:hypothetical protein